MALTQISTQGIKDGTITNADIGSSAAIAGSKISPDFGSQNITTTGNLDLGGLPDTTTNSYLKIPIQDSDGILRSDDSIKINPAQNALDVDGLNISSQVIRTNNTEELRLTTGAGNGTVDLKVNSNQITFLTKDNTTDAFTLKQGSNEYITVDTNNSSELITLGNTTTNPKTAILGGNVGIGTTSPDGKLDVRGTIFVNGDATGGRIFASSGNLSLSDGNGRQILRIDDPGPSNSHTHVFDSNGRLGINTTNPRSLLDLGAGSGDGSLSTTLSQYQIMLEAPQGTGDYGRNIGWSVGTNGLVAAINAVDVGTSDATGLAFITGNNSAAAERMRIDSSGSVGIGVTSANDTATALTIKNMASGSEHTILEIICDDNETSRVTFSETSTLNNGSIRYSFTGDLRAMTFHTNGNDERMRIDSTGDIGLGTNSPNLSSFSSPVTSIGKSGNPYSVLELQGDINSDGAFGVITGYNSGGSARGAQINMNRDRNDTSGAISFETSNNGSLVERFRITRYGGLATSQSNQAIIGRDWTSGTLAAGDTVNWNGAGGANSNGKLNFNSIGGNGGGHITCLSVSSFDQNPSGALIVAGVHGQGFNSYDTILSNFDSGISVTFNGTVTIENTSSELLYYAVNVIHMGTGNASYFGR